ncbi:MAG: glycerophosphodiester phosphodiesterase [Bacilli bacterium]|nr:glycerophosphodiester phosphodiesterase [Bacilli bacterium]
MKIIAHRGNDEIHKENSFESIINSLNKKYVDGVEFDIRLSKDDKFVINHDPFYKGLFIRETSSKHLKTMGLNTLDEVINCITNSKIILIDVKVNDDIEKTSKILKRYLNKKLNYYICSFNYSFINCFDSKYKKGLIISRNLKYIDKFDFNLINYKYRGKYPKKETFYWTINNVKDIKGENIITDRPKKISDFIKKNS